MHGRRYHVLVNDTGRVKKGRMKESKGVTNGQVTDGLEGHRQDKNDESEMTKGWGEV